MRVLFFLLLGFAPAEARWIPFDPFRFQLVDEAERRPDFQEFRSKLIRTLDNRDLAALRSFVATDIRISLDDKNRKGWDAFVSEWRLTEKKIRDSQLWDRLRETLRLGGSFEGEEFHSPYVFSRWPSRYPRLDFYAVISRSASLRRKPSFEAGVLETLSQELVGRFDAVPNPPGWRAVRAASGNTGYMRSEDTRSPLDYRAVFRKIKGEWKLVLFASGDWEAHERFE